MNARTHISLISRLYLWKNASAWIQTSVRNMLFRGSRILLENKGECCASITLSFGFFMSTETVLVCLAKGCLLWFKWNECECVCPND